MADSKKKAGQRLPEKSGRHFRLVRAAFAVLFIGLSVWVFRGFSRTGWTLFLGCLFALAALFNIVDVINGPGGKEGGTTEDVVDQ